MKLLSSFQLATPAAIATVQAFFLYLLRDNMN